MKNIDKYRIMILSFFIFLFFAMCAVYTIIPYVGDDCDFIKYISERNFFEYVLWRYNNWSGRVSVESLIYILYKPGIKMIFNVIGSIVFVIFVDGIISLSVVVTGAGIDNKNRFFLCLLLCGIIASFDYILLGYSCILEAYALNYLWPVTAFIWAMINIIKYIKDEKISFLSFFITVLLCFFVVLSQEQIALVLTGVIVTLFIYKLYLNKKINVLLLSLFIICVIGIFILANSPGTAARGVGDGAYAGFSNLDGNTHIFRTSQWIAFSVAMDNCNLYVLLWICLAVALWDINRKCSFLSMVFVIVGMINLFSGNHYLADLGIGRATLDSPAYKLNIGEWNMLGLNGRILIIYWLFALMITGYLICLAFRDDKFSGIGLGLLYCAGICTMMLIHFSHDIYNSGNRTTFFNDVFIVFIIICLISKCIHKKKKYLIALSVIVIDVLRAIDSIKYVLEYINRA